MKNFKLLFGGCILLFTIIFILFNKDYSLNVTLVQTEDVLVFYSYNEELVGTKLIVKNNKVEDIFNYLTINKNASPLLFYSPIDDNIKLLSYEIQKESLILFLSDSYKEEDISKTIPLLFESYKILGFDKLTIKTSDFEETYDENKIFELGLYKNYEDDTKDGSIIYLYTLNGSYVYFDSSFETTSETSYIMNNLNLDLDYNIYSKKLYILNNNTYEIDYLKELLQYNFRDFEIIIE